MTEAERLRQEMARIRLELRAIERKERVAAKYAKCGRQLVSHIFAAGEKVCACGRSARVTCPQCQRTFRSWCHEKAARMCQPCRKAKREPISNSRRLAREARDSAELRQEVPPDPEMESATVMAWTPLEAPPVPIVEEPVLPRQAGHFASDIAKDATIAAIYPSDHRRAHEKLRCRRWEGLDDDTGQYVYSKWANLR